MNDNLTAIITLLSITGTIANIYHKRWCFIIWLFTNSAWFLYDVYIGAYWQATLFLVYVWLAVWGLIEWGKENKMNYKKRVDI
jgi:hypothetical protein